MTSPLISADALPGLLGDPKLVVLDASWYMPGDKRDTKAEYLAGHIPGAAFFDLDENSDKASPYPHMLLAPAAFEAVARGLGVNNDSTIVVYDTAGLFSAARVWWNFRVMGAQNVAVLDGGLKLWAARGLPIETGPVAPAPGDFTARYDAGLVRGFDDMLGLVGQGGATIVDARGAPRFSGEAAEPRPGLASGHMPGARNVPYSKLIDADGTVRPREQIAAAFAEAGVDIGAPIVTTCGSGVTASVLALGLAVLGRGDVPVYDGSWSEWGARPESRGLVATGPA